MRHIPWRIMFWLKNPWDKLMSHCCWLYISLLHPISIMFLHVYSCCIDDIPIAGDGTWGLRDLEELKRPMQAPPKIGTSLLIRGPGPNRSRSWIAIMLSMPCGPTQVPGTENNWDLQMRWRLWYMYLYITNIYIYIHMHIQYTCVCV